jgi:predicted O-methyltransferase YrrM
MISLNINFKNTKTELCDIGAKYDTDKSSQRQNITDFRHCHPYTIFYNSLFKNNRNDNINIAEIGILDGASLLMWREYFTNANIYGFEYNVNFINNFKNKFNNDRITLSQINVNHEDSIKNAFNNDLLYDIIIEDSTHQFNDQIRVIENTYDKLKPGGIMIIEDIFLKYKEQDYIDKLQPILHHFQNYYFITLDHKNRNSTGWNNDKLFVLVKNGEPIFKNNNKITIITPSCRPENLINVKQSINFDYVHEWIIVYDQKKIIENPKLFNHDKIKELIYEDDGISGNPQRNHALDNITNTNTYLYYLDDDNTIHPDFYKLLDIIDDNKFYSFDQKDRIAGNNIKMQHIDTAMVLIDFNTCKNIRWKNMYYESDGMYIETCYMLNRDNWIYINNDICTYNSLT